MSAKLPIIGSTCTAADAVRALMQMRFRQNRADLAAGLAVILQAQSVHTLNSGIACFYAILETLKTLSPNKEVVLPAYTAGSLVVAVRKAGLVPVLCDISLGDFNADQERVCGALTAHTLAVVAVHMFGIPVGYLDTLRAAVPKGVFLIEDCCQSMASRIQDRPAGSFSDIGFFSFNRGKNFAAHNGGCIVVRNQALQEPLRRSLKSLTDNRPQPWMQPFFETLLFMAGTNPSIFGIAHAFAGFFRETQPPSDIPVTALGDFQSSLALRCLPKAETAWLARFRNGMALLRSLAGVPGLRLPCIGADMLPVFNRLPILFEDPERLLRKQKELLRAGFETSQMYMRPLHRMFALGYNKDDFPNACFLAEHLLTLPVHPGLSAGAVERIAEVIKR